MVWDVFKAHSRGQYISLMAAVKSEQTELASSLQGKVDSALNQYSSSSTPKNFDYLSSTRRELNLHLSKITRLGI